MPCHLSHAWHSEISEDSSLPFLHDGDCVAMELKNAMLKPIHAAVLWDWTSDYRFKFCS
uniref:Uncharacterized protein n=1 Tax=Glycine max TaxID=3847 RepID=C6T4D2_SOYBN|nr:unknown [Glycine max]